MEKKLENVDSDQIIPDIPKQSDFIQCEQIKFFLDENLLRSGLLFRAQQDYPESTDAKLAGFLKKNDSQIIDYAFNKRFTVITCNRKDFKERYVNAPHPGVVYFVGRSAKGTLLLNFLNRTINEIQNRRYTSLKNLVITTTSKEVRIEKSRIAAI